MRGNQTTLTVSPYGGIGQLGSGVSDNGSDIFTQWKHRFSDHSETTLQFYDSHYERVDAGIHEQLGTANFDFQHHVQIGSRNDVVWGVSTRLTQDHFGTRPGSMANTGFAITFQPDAKDYALFSSFFQDEISLTHSLSVTVGTKVEHNAFTGFENEPSVRAAWLLTDSQTLWASASRAIRQPSRLETGLDVVFSPVSVGPASLAAAVVGNKDFQSETVEDYEAGYRVQPFERVSVDVASFYGRYHNLESDAPSLPEISLYGGLPLITFPFQFANSKEATSYGGELSTTWNASSRLKLIGTYSLLETQIGTPQTAQTLPKAGSNLSAGLGQAASLMAYEGVLQYLNAFAPDGGNVQGGSPRNQAGLRSYLYLTSAISFDTSYYYVGGLPARQISAYNRVDARLAWKLKHNFQLSLVGQNLLQPRHMEFGDDDQVVGTDAERNIFARLAWSF
ncbi:MAG: TonB-dependent receptor [Acidobacteriota bacterium]|nr:TonB-dependent receptor [Acidobacteriota bacterium]